MNVIDRFWNATVMELKQGYEAEEEAYVCLLCGERVEKGVIYPLDDRLLEAERYIQMHISRVHGSVFDYLIQMNKQFTGLTEHQNKLLRLFYQGKNDKEVQQELGIGSASTIRNHRFALKEKERQAKVFMVLMELLKEKDDHAPTFVPVHHTATMVDDRFNVTQEESEQVLKKYFPDGLEGRLSTFAMKEKYKLVILREIIQRFERKKMYTEREVNQVLKSVFDDFVTLRRYLIEYGFLDRKDDGSQYWVKER